MYKAKSCSSQNGNQIHTNNEFSVRHPFLQSAAQTAFHSLKKTILFFIMSFLKVMLIHFSNLLLIEDKPRMGMRAGMMVLKFFRFQQPDRNHRYQGLCSYK